jgi:hypothetical protein
MHHSYLLPFCVTRCYFLIKNILEDYSLFSFSFVNVPLLVEINKRNRLKTLGEVYVVYFIHLLKSTES